MAKRCPGGGWLGGGWGGWVVVGEAEEALVPLLSLLSPAASLLPFSSCPVSGLFSLHGWSLIRGGLRWWLTAMVFGLSEVQLGCSVLVAAFGVWSCVTCVVFGCGLGWGLTAGFRSCVWSLVSCGVVVVGGVWLRRLDGCWWC
ncbi:hypothetical protein Droror1_Dr00013017 [Drosera rotundifolia]